MLAFRGSYFFGILCLLRQREKRYHFSVLSGVLLHAHNAKLEWFYSTRYCHCSITCVLQLNHEQFWLPFRLKYARAAYVMLYTTFFSLHAKIYTLPLAYTYNYSFTLDYNKFQAVTPNIRAETWKDLFIIYL